MDFKDQKPIYLQIADHICNLILTGQLGEGDKLSSVREYAAEMEVNVNTVARSFEWLQNHQVIQSRRGLGNFVSPGAKQAIESERREEFYTQQIPELHHTMQALGITIDDLVDHLKQISTT